MSAVNEGTNQVFQGNFSCTHYSLTRICALYVLFSSLIPSKWFKPDYYFDSELIIQMSFLKMLFI